MFCFYKPNIFVCGANNRPAIGSSNDQCPTGNQPFFVCDGGEAAVGPDNDQCIVGQPVFTCPPGYGKVEHSNNIKCKKEKPEKI